MGAATHSAPTRECSALSSCMYASHAGIESSRSRKNPMSPAPSRVDQHVATGITTESSGTTRPKDPPHDSSSRSSSRRAFVSRT